MTVALDWAQVRRILPHRYPMLLVDQVNELVPGQSLIATKAVSGNEPWYAELAEDAGPQAHAYPTALVIESWCQSAGILAAWDAAVDDRTVMLFGSMSGIKVAGTVSPGQVLTHRVRLVRALAGTMIFDGESEVAGRPVLSAGRVVMAVRPRSTPKR